MANGEKGLAWRLSSALADLSLAVNDFRYNLSYGAIQHLTEARGVIKKLLAEVVSEPRGEWRTQVDEWLKTPLAEVLTGLAEETQEQERLHEIQIQSASLANKLLELPWWVQTKIDELATPFRKMLV